MKKIIILAVMMTLVSCGKKNKQDVQALRSASSGQDPYSQLIAIKQQYGITNDTDIVSVLHSIKTDLRDSGVYINVDHEAKLRAVPAEGVDWSQAKVARISKNHKRVKRLISRGKMVLKKTVNECEDLVVSTDRVDDGSYDSSRVAPLIEQYVTLAQAYLIENNLNEQNCLEYKEIDQAQLQFKRHFMGSISAGNIQGSNGEVRNISGLNPTGRGTRQVLPK